MNLLILDAGHAKNTQGKNNAKEKAPKKGGRRWLMLNYPHNLTLKL